jgi:hypothetical protein
MTVKRQPVTKSPPIVFVQRGRTFYFPTVLVQAARRCASSRIYVISDVAPASYLPARLASSCVWVPVSSVDASADDFRRHYVHLSVNRPWLEQLCFERWFMIRELARRQGFPAVLHLDSDVLVESDIGQHLARRDGPSVMFSRRMGPHVAYFREVAYLERLCDDIIDTYRSSEGVAGLRRAYQAILDRGHMGAISDMFFFERLVDSAGAAYGDTFDVVEGEFFDHSMGMSEGYVSRLGTKVVRHRGSEAFCRRVDSGEWVRVLALHFQGITKIWMGWHADVRMLSDVARSARLWFWGGVSYAGRVHRYVMRKWIVVWRRWNARTAT